MVIYFITMTVTFIHFITVYLLCHRTALDRATLRTQTHRAAHIRIGATFGDLAIAIQPFGDQRHDRMLSLEIKFCTVCIAHA